MIIEGYGLPDDDNLYSFPDNTDQNIIKGIYIQGHFHSFDDVDGLSYTVVQIPHSLFVTIAFVSAAVFFGFATGIVSFVVILALMWLSQKTRMFVDVVYKDGYYITGYTYNPLEQRIFIKETRPALGLVQKPRKFGVVNEDGTVHKFPSKKEED